MRLLCSIFSFLALVPAAFSQGSTIELLLQDGEFRSSSGLVAQTLRTVTLIGDFVQSDVPLRLQVRITGSAGTSTFITPELGFSANGSIELTQFNQAADNRAPIEGGGETTYSFNVEIFNFTTGTPLLYSGTVSAEAQVSIATITTPLTPPTGNASILINVSALPENFEGDMTFTSDFDLQQPEQEDLPDSDADPSDADSDPTDDPTPPDNGTPPGDGTSSGGGSSGAGSSGGVSDGADGSDGTDGSDGSDGSDGADGAQGPAGRDGEDGEFPQDQVALPESRDSLPSVSDSFMPLLDQRDGVASSLRESLNITVPSPSSPTNFPLEVSLGSFGTVSYLVQASDFSLIRSASLLGLQLFFLYKLIRYSTL